LLLKLKEHVLNDGQELLDVAPLSEVESVVVLFNEAAALAT
jgi:hypothetical protein